MNVEIDVAIFGGGIAGLWLLNRLRRAGYDALLFEPHALGNGQTLSSQGILHSGVKYAFDQWRSDPGQSLALMPQLWLDCIAGRGEIDLTGVQITAPQQCLFTDGSLASRLTSAVAGKALQRGMTAIKEENFPAIFRETGFTGKLFALAEPVLAVKTVLTSLRDHAASAQGPAVFAARVKSIQRENSVVKNILLDDSGGTVVQPRACFFAAGPGNEKFAEEFGLDRNAITQRRPLRMFMARGLPHPLFAHWLVPEPKPRLTITTHELEGENMWYIGGNIAEKTRGLEVKQALTMAQAEVAAVFPKIDWSVVRWALHDIDRSESFARQRLPSAPKLHTDGNAALAWPSKLVLAPALANQGLAWLGELGLKPSHRQTTLPLPIAEVGKYPWEENHTWMTL